MVFGNISTPKTRKKSNFMASLPKTKELSNNQLIANKESIGNQLVTNKEPIGNQLVTTKVTNKEPIGNQLVTNKESIGNQKKRISNQLVTTLVTKLVTNRESISNQLVTKTTFKELPQLQRLIIAIIFNDIKFSNDSISGPIALSYLSEMTKTTAKSVKTATQRLVKRRVLKREGGKRGQGGWAKFSIENSLYNDMLQSELVTNKESIGNQLVTTLVTNKEPHRESRSPSSSSSNINTTTTKESLEKIQIPPNLKNLGFGIGHIKQLKEKFNLSLDQIQKNLESFAYDLDNGEFERLKGRGVQNIIGYFFGAMKNGGYNSVKEGFVTAEEFAEQEMLERLEKKKTEREERKKKLEELLFKEWLETKTRGELIEIEKPALDVMDSFHKAALKRYFIDNKLEKFQQEYSNAENL